MRTIGLFLDIFLLFEKVSRFFQSKCCSNCQIHSDDYLQYVVQPHQPMLWVGKDFRKWENGGERVLSLHGEGCQNSGLQ